MTTGFKRNADAAFGDALSPEERWGDHRLHVLARRRRRASLRELVRAKHLDEAIDLTKGAAGFEAPRSLIPDRRPDHRAGREFHPPVVSSRCRPCTTPRTSRSCCAGTT